MSLHKDPKYQTPDLIAALKQHGLAVDTPSQLSDSFRVGWVAGRLALRVEQLTTRIEPVHYRALLAEEQRPHQLKTSLHVVGFRDRQACENFIAGEKDMNGWNYTLEELYNRKLP